MAFFFFLPSNQTQKPPPPTHHHVHRRPFGNMHAAPAWRGAGLLRWGRMGPSTHLMMRQLSSSSSSSSSPQPPTVSHHRRRPLVPPAADPHALEALARFLGLERIVPGEGVLDLSKEQLVALLTTRDEGLVKSLYAAAEAATSKWVG